jgi:hypothetical protein
MNHLTKTVLTLITVLLLFSCSDKFDKVSEDKFIGLWEIKGKSLTNGMQIKIERENNELIGRIYKLNDNKYVKLFADSNAVWISEIKRANNYEFNLKENKIAKELFALYGQSTSQEYKVQFIDDNTIGLATGNSDPTASKEQYRRINNVRQQTL